DRGMLLHADLAAITDTLYGFDYDEEGLETLRSYGYGNLFRADLESLADAELEEKFDVIIAGEMIEHLSNPGLFLNGIKRFMDKNTRLVITTVNAYGAIRLSKYFLRG